MPRSAGVRRFGFAVSGVVVALVVLVFALGIYKASVVWSIPTHTAYAAGKKFGIIAAPFVWTGIAALLGWLAYRATGRSESAGNVVAGVGLAALATIWSIQVVNYWTHAPTQPATPPAAQGDSREALRRIAEAMKAPTPRGPDPTPPQPGPQSAPPAPPPTAMAPTGPTKAAPRPAPVRPVTPRPAPREDNPAVKETLDVLSKDLDAAAGALLLQAEPILDKLDKPPAHTREAIEKRLKDLASLRSSAHELAERFHGLKDEAEKKLTAAGVDKTEAFSASVRYSLESKGMERAMACDEYGRLCDTAQEESEFLRDNITKWWNDAVGMVASKDNIVKARAESFRSRIRSELRKRDEMASRLRGG